MPELERQRQRDKKKRRMKYFKNKNKTSSDTVNHTSDVAWDLSRICQILVDELL